MPTLDASCVEGPTQKRNKALRSSSRANSIDFPFAWPSNCLIESESIWGMISCCNALYSIAVAFHSLKSKKRKEKKTSALNYLWQRSMWCRVREIGQISWIYNKEPWKPLKCAYVLTKCGSIHMKGHTHTPNAHEMSALGESFCRVSRSLALVLYQIKK